MSALLSVEQREIRSVADQFLQRTFTSPAIRAAAQLPLGYDEGDWARIIELGWPALAVPEEHGGLGFGQLERCLLQLAMGAVLSPLPFLSSAVMATDALVLLADGGSGELLSAAAEGSKRLALVAHGDLHSQQAAPAGVRAEVAGGEEWALSGAGGAALDAAGADVLLIVAEADGGLGLFAVQAGVSGLSTEPVDQMDASRRFARVTLSGAPGTRLDDGQRVAERLDEVMQRAALGLAAEMAGGAVRAADMAIDYAKERRQFGSPIGSFQTIKHMCADMAIEADAAVEAVLHAAEVADHGDQPGAALLARAAKATVGDAFVLAAASSVQIHGGIGFTEEHDAQLFFKRAHVAQRMLGTSAAWRENLAHRLGW